VNSERKRGFYRDIVLNGIKDFRDLQKLYPLGWQVTDSEVRSWLGRFYREPKLQEYRAIPRLINHFMLGADPEFIFTELLNGRRIDANLFKMKAGRAYGADNNGRLVEIRPAPNKNSLAVLASILDTFRWMSATVPETNAYNWVCGPYLQEDGLGGHVHLGRRNKVMYNNEVKGLDSLAESLEKSGMYPAHEMDMRRAGDAHNQRYGRPGDVRPQPYGYEYRTFPSWLDSPWIAYLHLVLSKIAVYDPELFYHARGVEGCTHVTNLLRYYRGLDDDALLAYGALQRLGMPKHIGGDFRPRWGMDGKRPHAPQVTVVPGAITGHKDTLTELWEHLAHGAPLAVGALRPATWTPTELPKGYVSLLDTVETRGIKGIGEIVCDLCTYGGGFHVTGKHLEDPYLIAIGRQWANLLPQDWRERVPKDSIYVGGDWNGIAVNNQGNHKQVIELMIGSGMFPVWKIKDVKLESYKEWQAALGKMKQEAVACKHTYVGREEIFA